MEENGHAPYAAPHAPLRKALADSEACELELCKHLLARDAPVIVRAQLGREGSGIKQRRHKEADGQHRESAQRTRRGTHQESEKLVVEQLKGHEGHGSASWQRSRSHADERPRAGA